MPYELNTIYTLAFSRFASWNGQRYIVLKDLDTGSEKPQGFESSPWVLRVMVLPFQENWDDGEKWTQYKCKCIGYMEDTLTGKMTGFPKLVQDINFINEKLYGNAVPDRPLQFEACDAPGSFKRDGRPVTDWRVQDPQTRKPYTLFHEPDENLSGLGIGQKVSGYLVKNGEWWQFLSEAKYRNEVECKRRIETMSKVFPANTEADCKVLSIDSTWVKLRHSQIDSDLLILRSSASVLPRIGETVRVKCRKISDVGFPILAWAGDYARTVIPVDRLPDLSLPAGGESKEVEYKSSLVYPVGATSPDIDKQLGQVIINAIAGMMNSKGGTIYVGVRDNGTICGVENEGSFLMTESEDVWSYKPTCDGMQQKITNTVKKKLGYAAASLVEVIPRRHPESQHLVLEIKVQANETDIPVYVNGKELFARYSGETQGLLGEAAARFIVDRLRRLDEKRHDPKGMGKEPVGAQGVCEEISQKLPVIKTISEDPPLPVSLPSMVPFLRQYVEALDGFEGLAFDGEYVGSAKTWPDLFVELLKQLAVIDPDKFEKLPKDPSFHARNGKPIFARTGQRIRIPNSTDHLGPKGDIRFDRTFGNKENFLRDNNLFIRLVRHFGLKPEQFTIWVGKQRQDISVASTPAVQKGNTAGSALPAAAPAPALAGHGQKLRVTFPDGSVLCERSAILTLVKAIEKIGSKKVMQLGILSRGVPLVADKKTDAASNKYATSYRETGDGYYVLSYSSTSEKAGLLNEIANRLNVTLKVEII